MIKQKIVALDISDYSIEAIVLSRSFGKIKIVSYARGKLSEGIVKNGVIKNSTKLASEIKRVLSSAKPGPITAPYCIVSIPDTQVFSTVFKLPSGLKHDEIKNTIPYKAEEVIPFKSSEVYFDFKVLLSHNGTKEVLYAASPSKVIDKYVDVLEEVNLTPIAFDLESLSAARSLIRKKSSSAVLFMDIGSRTTNLNIFDRNGVRSSLVVNVAGNNFTKTIAKSQGISELKAEEIKIKNGLNPKGGKPKVVTVIQQELDKIVLEVKKIISYYFDETQNQVESVVLSGGSSLLPGTEKYLTEKIGLPVFKGNPLDRIHDKINISKVKSKAVLFTNVIGLALRAVTNKPSFEDINLLPERKRKFAVSPRRADRRAWRMVYIRLTVFISLVVLFLVVMFIRNTGFDFYNKVVPAVKYEADFADDINMQALDELREFVNTRDLEEVSTSTPTSTEEIIIADPVLVVINTPTSHLNVRSGPGVNFPKVDQVVSGGEHELVEEKDGWYLIQINEDSQGWVSSLYVDKL